MSREAAAARNWLPQHTEQNDSVVCAPSQATYTNPLPTHASIKPSPERGLFDTVFGPIDRDKGNRVLMMAGAYNTQLSPELAEETRKGDPVPAILVGMSLIPAGKFPALLKSMLREFGPLSENQLGYVLREISQGGEAGPYLKAIGAQAVQRLAKVYIPHVDAGRQVFKEVQLLVHEYKVGPEWVGEGNHHVIRDIFIENKHFNFSVHPKPSAAEAGGFEEEYWKLIQDEVRHFLAKQGK